MPLSCRASRVLSVVNRAGRVRWSSMTGGTPMRRSATSRTPRTCAGGSSNGRARAPGRSATGWAHARPSRVRHRSAEPLGVRRDEVERPVVEARPQHQLHDRGGDEVHRNHVGVAEFRDGHGQRGRQLRECGERWEEVVGAVHLVHLAGDRAPDHSCWTIDPPRNAGGAHQPLGLELGAVVRRREVLAEVEVVLGELAAVIAGHRDGRDVGAASHRVPRRDRSPPGCRRCWSTPAPRPR